MSVLQAEPEVRTVEAAINYVAHGSFVNRRFVAPGVARNTGRYETHSVAIRDGGENKDHLDQVYPGEVVAAFKALTGATRVAPMGWMIRTSGDLSRHRQQTVGYT